MAGEFGADSDDRAGGDLVVVIVVLDFDVDLHLQRWNVAEDFVQLVELPLWQLNKLIEMDESDFQLTDLKMALISSTGRAANCFSDRAFLALRNRMKSSLKCGSCMNATER